MSEIVDKIKGAREEILKGEIGALLHDIGKCHPNFIKMQSIEKTPDLPPHASGIDNFLNPNLLELIKKVNIQLAGENKTTYDLIRFHHNASGKVLGYLKTCDQLDSADDKGIVRKKQALDQTYINSPFCFPKEKIDLVCLKKKLDDLQAVLIDLLQQYVSSTLDISCLRKSINANLISTFSHALGETRIPSNDVTLWDHSHSTASLFKSALCAAVLNNNLNPEDLRWHIFGIGWDGIGFINKGRKIADILQRYNIIKAIKEALRNKFEDELPIGNVIYEDDNSIYFTFPALSDDCSKEKELAKECAKCGLEIIRKKSDHELWPFFTLSKASRSLTVLVEELEFATNQRKIPKITPSLFLASSAEREKIELGNHDIYPCAKEKDTCPVCRIRTKLKNEEMCEICRERRKGRLSAWFSDREQTIWTDEVADLNNRLALITLSFDLEKWLDGTMTGTIYSQSFEGWKNSEKWKDVKDIGDLSIKATKDSVYEVIEKILELKECEQEKAAQLLDTFFEEKVGLSKGNFKKHLDNITKKIQPLPLNTPNLAAYLFTQNASPARLYRIWEETEEFFTLVANQIKSTVYEQKWKRIIFSVDIQDIEAKLKQEKKLENNTTFLLKFKDLEPQNLLVLHEQNGKFYTIESIKKFSLKDKTEEEAVKEALQQGFTEMALEDKANENLLNNGEVIKIKEESKVEKYIPIIIVNKSPLSLRLLIPALDSTKVAELIIKLYNIRFEKVIGKLPLNVGFVISKRKYPLYVLLDAGQRLFSAAEFKEPVMMDTWWDIAELRNDKYYGFYPLRKNAGQKYTLDDLSALSKGKPYALYPGYFDFELVLGTQDRFNIIYNHKKERMADDYRLFSRRPYFFYQISQMIDLWEILQNNLGSTQINFIELIALS